MDAVFRHGGTVLFQKEVINVYINMLAMSINSILLRGRDNHNECTYMDVVQQAKGEEDELRARLANVV